MLIGRSEPRFLLPVPKFEWRERSLAQPKDQFGRGDRTRFMLRAWKVDGGLVRDDWYEDRDEFDYELWRIAFEEPRLDLRYEFATVTLFSSGAGSNQTWTRPSDFNSADNLIELLGAGGRGGRVTSAGARRASGGGGGAYSAIENFAAGATETYRIGAAAAALSSASNVATAGVAGEDSWFGGTDFASCDVGAKAGLGGAATGSTGASANGGLGGDGASGVGTVKNSGGRGGNGTGGTLSGLAGQATGAGAAAGPNGDGGNGVDTTELSSLAATNGGTGDNGDGGASGPGSTSGNGSPGGNGDNIGSGAGPGGGGGGSARGTSVPTGGAGGNYGAGSGAAMGNEANAAVNAAAQGAMWITYEPLVVTGGFLMMF